MKKKLMVVLIGLLMAIPLLFVSAGSASATCTAQVNTANNYRSVLDDEQNGYVRFYVSIHYYDCGNYRTFRYVTEGYLPDTAHNSSLRCGNDFDQIYHVRMNLGSIVGHNPATWEVTCSPYGDSVTYDYANVNYWDWESPGGDARCVGSHWTAVINNWPDVGGDVPQVCF